MARRLLFLTMIIMVTGGCARTIWTKAGFSADEWQRDNYACERDMRQSGYFGSGVWGQMEAQKFFDRCLASKGYFAVKE